MQGKFKFVMNPSNHPNELLKTLLMVFLLSIDYCYKKKILIGLIALKDCSILVRIVFQCDFHIA